MSRITKTLAVLLLTLAFMVPSTSYAQTSSSGVQSQIAMLYALIAQLQAQLTALQGGTPSVVVPPTPPTIPTIPSIPATPNAPSVTISSPNGGEQYVAGSNDSLTIKWKASNIPSSSYLWTGLISSDGRQFTFPGDGSCTSIRNGTNSCTGRLIQNSGYNLAPGSYRVVVQVMAPPDGSGKDGKQLAYDESDRTITLISGKSDSSNEAVEVDSISTSQTLNTGTTPSSNYGTYTVKYEVTANSRDTYIPNTASIGGGTTGAGYTVNGFTSFSGTKSAVLTSTADRTSGGSYYIVREGETEVFTLTVTLDPNTSGSYAVALSNVNYALSPIAPTWSVNLDGKSDFATKALFISDGNATPATPSITLSASPTSIARGASSKISWSVKNATACHLKISDGTIIGDVGTNNSQVVYPTQTTDYTLVCGNDEGSGGKDGPSANKTVTVSVSTGLGVYKGYMNGSQFITTQNITQADALANCKLNARNNPTSSVRCTWQGDEIYSSTPAVSTPTATVTNTTSTSAYPTISGTATGVSSIVLSIASASGDKAGGSNTISIVNGKWSYTLTNEFESGTYKVTIYGNSQVIGTGSFTVRLPVETPAPSRGEVQVVGVYEGTYSGPSHSFGYHPTGSVNVRVTGTPSAPATLVLTSYEPVNWNISRDSSDSIARIITIGYYDQTVSGASGVPVESHSYSSDGVYQYAYSNGSSEYNSLNSWLSGKGYPISTFTGSYTGSDFTVYLGAKGSASDRNANLASAYAAIQAALEALLKKTQGK